MRLWFPFWVNTPPCWVAGSSGSDRGYCCKHHPESNDEIEREATTARERLQGAAVTCHHLSQASGSRSAFPTAKFRQPLACLIATGATLLWELEMILPHHKTLVETLKASRS